MYLNILLVVIARVAVVQKTPKETFISLLHLQLDSFLIICVFPSFTPLFRPQIWTKESYVQAARFFRQETRSKVKDELQTEITALKHFKRLFLEKVAEALNWNRSGNRKKQPDVGDTCEVEMTAAVDTVENGWGPKGGREELMKIHILSSEIHE